MLALHFLIEDVRGAERILYVALSESDAELRLVAKRHGWTMDHVDIFELVPPETTLEREPTVLHPAEIELSQGGGTLKLEQDDRAWIIGCIGLGPSSIAADRSCRTFTG